MSRPRRKRPPMETPEYAVMMRRMVQAYGRRVAAADPEDLTDMLALKAELDAAIVAAVRGQVERGTSWARIGEGLRISRQAAFERFRQRSADTAA